ncbi:Gfo/Idh/MocA family protein [Tautonia plasticadhaerens]|uniref:Inositol 2-dehydrogenase n=1 Tax=Tautonia plasticadhaerens TaxID=2527974 RepID=A0A518GV67_9BACT|nr:Gfo/Idh/MocA family oxidoreductase [Tautonia plasticadhaerens]QDV32483.1 Inositol 2-dehydrogenase [Tautonia plasticadhaerens]
MPPIRMNRRHFLGCSAAAGWAISQGREVEGAMNLPPVRLGLIGLGNRGTALLRAALDLPEAEIVAVADVEERHRRRACGIAEKARGRRPDEYADPSDLLVREDVEAVLVALPNVHHLSWNCLALASGKHLYAEKPLCLTLEECDLLIAEADRRPDQVVHVGFQRRSNPRFREGVELIRSGELGSILEARSSWTSSNGPVDGHLGWLGKREQSGDWMMEQGVHVWDWLHWIAGGPPARACGYGRRDVFADLRPGRDVTDHYTVTLEWPDGFHASFVHSWVDPADDSFTGISQRVVGTAGGFDFGTGTATFRDRSLPRRALHPGNLPDTRFALSSFLFAIRSPEPIAPPVTLAEARDATLTALLVRKAVDERRVVGLDEVGSGPAA